MKQTEYANQKARSPRLLNRCIKRKDFKEALNLQLSSFLLVGFALNSYCYKLWQPNFRCLALHWLPVLFRVNFKVLLLTFKAIRKLAPSYINDLFKIKPLNSRYGLQSNDGILHPNLKTLTTLGDRAFATSAPKLWNDLLSDIRMAKFVDTFKKLLKTHLFSKVFYS